VITSGQGHDNSHKGTGHDHNLLKMMEMRQMMVTGTVMHKDKEGPQAKTKKKSEHVYLVGS
jgi:hypothetical protein